MFGIPGKQAVTMTPKAAEQIVRLMNSGGHAGLRIGVKKGGCAGMEYTMDYVDEADPNDEVVEQDGACVMRAEIDYICINVASGRPQRMPAGFVAAYAAV